MRWGDGEAMNGESPETHVRRSGVGHRWRLGVAAFGTLLLVACGARTAPWENPPPRRDAGVISSDSGVDAGGARDAGPGDAGTDAGRRDSGVDAGQDSGVVLGCQTNSDCPSGVCGLDRGRPLTDLEPAPLLCQELPAATGRRCSGPDDEQGLCTVSEFSVEPCRITEDCPMGHRCLQVFVRTGAGRLQPVQACVDEVSEGEGVEASVESLPNTDVVTIPFVGQEQISVLENDTTEFWPPVRMTGPDGRVVYEFGSVNLNPVAATLMPVAQMPNAGAMLASGDYDLEFISSAPVPSPPPSWRHTLLRRVAEPARKILDLEVFVVEGISVDRELFAEVMTHAATLHRFEIGEVHFHEITGGLGRRMRFIDTDRDTELPQLYRLSAGINRPALSVFLVSDAGEAVGIAGGIPGAQAVHGTQGSGILIAWELLVSSMQGREFLPKVAGHEFGHHLGLFHTTEADGQIFEPLGDTPECPLTEDVNDDGILAPDECAAFGGDNLMFWTGSGEVVSPLQRGVIDSALWYR